MRLLLAASTFISVFLFSQIAFSALIISEYVEGSSDNKAVELFNTGSSTITLSDIVINIYFNGNNTASSSVNFATLSVPGSLAPGEVFVVANNDWDVVLGGTIDLSSGSLNFNGNDAVEVVLSGSTVDVIGQIGFDPGSQWGTGDQSTQDNTLTRNTTILTGDISGSDTFDPSTEWRGGDQDVHSLGTHDGSFTPVPEPSALLCVGLVLAGTTFVRRYAWGNLK